MNPLKVAIGNAYYDGKQGLREVIAIDPTESESNTANTQITYKILSAKQTSKYSYLDNKKESLIGRSETISITSFRKWAKIEIQKDNINEILLEIKLKTLKLSPTETRLMESIYQECGLVTMHTQITINSLERRPAYTLAKKGLLNNLYPRETHLGEIELTDLGSTWLKIHHQRVQAGTA